MNSKLKNILKNNNSGMTLVEVLITLAIMSIMIVPVFDVFVETKEINHKTATTVAANFIGQKVLEDLKSDVSLIEGTTIKTVDGYDVTIKIEDISESLTYDPSSDSVNNGQGTVIPSADITVKYKESDSEDILTVEGIDYSYSNAEFEIEFNPVDSGQISSRLLVGSGTTQTQNSIKNIVMTDDDPAVVSIDIDGQVSEAKFTISNNTDFKVAIYEIDDVSNKVSIIPSITNGNGEISTYQSKRSNAASGLNETQLFTIELEIRRNGTLYERLVSTAKK